MVLDIALSASLAVCTIVMAYLGVHVTLHPPNESARARKLYKAGFVICGVCSVGLVIWQGVRGRDAQVASAHRIDALQDDVRAAKIETQNARHDVERESTRRGQAEKDLAIIVQATGKSTREGVAEDFKKTSIEVKVNGQPTDEATIKRQRDIRNRLGQFLAEDNTLKSKCLEAPAEAGFSCLKALTDWYNRIKAYIGSAMEVSYLPRFDAATGLSLNYTGPSENNNSINFLTFKAAILQEFIKENTPAH